VTPVKSTVIASANNCAAALFGRQQHQLCDRAAGKSPTFAGPTGARMINSALRSVGQFVRRIRRIGFLNLSKRGAGGGANEASTPVAFDGARIGA